MFVKVKMFFTEWETLLSNNLLLFTAMDCIEL